MSIIGSSIQPDHRCASLLPIVLTKLGLIAASYPDTSKNSSGFRLDALVRNGSYFPQRVFAGAEGHAWNHNQSQIEDCGHSNV